MSTQSMLTLTRAQAAALAGPCMREARRTATAADWIAEGAMEPIHILSGPTWVLPTTAADLQMSDAQRTIMNGLSAASYDSADFTNPKTNYRDPLVNEIESFSGSTELAAIQGVAAGGDASTLFTSAVGLAQPGILARWTLSGSTWSVAASRALEAVADQVNHISDLYYKDGFIYLPDVYPYIDGQTDFSGCYSRVARFVAATLAFDSIVLSDNSTLNRTAEWCEYYDGKWWLGGDTAPVVRRYSDSWVFEQELALPVGDNSTIYTGYQGGRFFIDNGQPYLALSIHDNRPTMGLVICKWTGSAFVEVARKSNLTWANQGLSGAYGVTDLSDVWAADRTSTSGVVRRANLANWRLAA